MHIDQPQTTSKYIHSFVSIIYHFLTIVVLVKTLHMIIKHNVLQLIYFHAYRFTHYTIENCNLALLHLWPWLSGEEKSPTLISCTLRCWSSWEDLILHVSRHFSDKVITVSVQTCWGETKICWLDATLVLQKVQSKFYFKSFIWTHFIHNTVLQNM